MKPMIYREDGTSDHYEFDSEEQLMNDLNGHLKIIPLYHGWVMIINEDCISLGQRFNFAASIIAEGSLRPGVFIFGNAIVLHKRDLE